MKSLFARLGGWFVARPYLLLTVFCVALWLPGILSLPPLDRDESRFAQASKQMLENRNFVDIRFGEVPRYKKPVGVYWMQAATTGALGLGHFDRIWTYRVASLLGAILAVFATFRLARIISPPESGDRIALVAASLLGATLLLTAEATIATTDAILLAALTAAQTFFLRVYLADGKLPMRETIFGWTAFAIAILVKGPPAAFCLLTIAALCVWDRKWKWTLNTRPIVGILVTLVVVAPWVVAIMIASKGAFFQQSLGNDFATKLVGGQESHGAPPGYYLLLTTVTFFPAILFLAPSLWAAWKRNAEPAIRFLIVWTVAVWILVELIPTKLPHYIIPVFPALALFCAQWVVGGPGEDHRLRRLFLWIAGVQFTLTLLLLGAAPVLLPWFYGHGLVLWLLAPALVGLTLGLFALRRFVDGRHLPAVGFSIAAVLVLYPGLTAGAGPNLQDLWVSSRAADLVLAKKTPDDPPLSAAGYTEPSLMFLLGTPTHLLTGAGAAETVADAGGLALIEDSERPAFLARLAELEGDAEAIGEIDGYNYSRGRKVHITLYRTNAVPRVTAPPEEE